MRISLPHAKSVKPEVLNTPCLPTYVLLSLAPSPLPSLREEAPSLMADGPGGTETGNGKVGQGKVRPHVADVFQIVRVGGTDHG